MRLLLVEDDAMIGASIRTGLRQDGYTVDWVRDGAAATLATDTTAYDAILLDIGLPGKSGLELLAHWRGKRNDVPVLAFFRGNGFRGGPFVQLELDLDET